MLPAARARMAGRRLQRTNSLTGCPECAKLEVSARTKAGLKRSRKKREVHAARQAAALIEVSGDEDF